MSITRTLTEYLLTAAQHGNHLEREMSFNQASDHEQVDDHFQVLLQLLRREHPTSESA